MTEQEFEKKYGRPPVKHSGDVKTKIYWDRIVIALVLLVLLVFCVVRLIGALIGAFGGGESSSALPVVNNNKESSSEPEHTGYDFTVCIDPGHGGDDSGAQDKTGKRLEKDDTLNVSLKLRDELEALGVNVAMTRETDEFLTLDEICKKANDSKADLFISIHRNSGDEVNKGVEIWVNNHEPESDILLASNILSALDEVGISKNREVGFGFIGDSYSNYQVNRQTHMPSCLVELGFITNDADNKLLDEHIGEYAHAMAQAAVKTAKELGITDENGERLIDEPYLSTKPQWNEKTGTYFTEEGEIYAADALQPVIINDHKYTQTTSAKQDDATNAAAQPPDGTVG